MSLLLTALLQAAAPATPAADPLSQCRRLAGAEERLACYDRLADRVGAGRDGGLLVIERQTVVERRRRDFGLGTGGGDLFGGGPEDQATEIAQIDTTVRAVDAASTYGRFDLSLANGMVWQTVDTLPFPPRAGAPIRVERGTLGGYRASVSGGRKFLVKRLR